MRADLAYWVALTHYSKFGPRSLARLSAAFQNLETAWHASGQELLNLGFSQTVTDGFLYFRENLEPKRLLDGLAKSQISAITVLDQEYPALLKNIYDPPAVLYLQGQLPPDHLPTLAVVGSRHVSPYGAGIASEWSETLARQGVVIVSGLAYGVDELAHQGALNAKGKTVAVLASGLRNVGTSRQRYLAGRIVAEGGAVISEFAPEVAGLKHHFPIRNRVISGLSRATLVVEAALQSGSLITARCANDQGRDVLAVPGSIYSPTSEGTNELIKTGAGLVLKPADVLEALELSTSVNLSARATYQPVNEEEAAVTEYLSSQPIHLDEIIRETKLPASQVIKTLSLLEIKGHARQLNGNYYILA